VFFKADKGLMDSIAVTSGNTKPLLYSEKKTFFSLNRVVFVVGCGQDGWNFFA